MQPDPIGLKAADSRSPQSLNRYSYVENDPMNSTDPNGTNKSSVSCMRLRSWYDWDDGAREFFYTWYCYNNPDITVEGGDVGSQGGSYSSSVGNELIDQINALSRIDKCADAFGFKDDPLKKDRWIDHIRRGDVMFYHFRDTQPIPGNPLAANVVDYYYAARNVANSGSWGIQAEVNGVTVVSSLNPQVWDARKYNMIIVGPTAIPNVTTFHEFLHWESNAGHIAIADKLNLKLRGYSYSNEQEGRDAINDFIKNKCADKPKP